MADVDLVLPCLNEAAALPWVLARVPAGYRAIVVDNGSDDGSAEVARAAGATVSSNARGGSARRWPRGSTQPTAPIVAVCDADASLDPAELPRLVALLGERRRPRPRPPGADAPLRLADACPRRQRVPLARASAGVAGVTA